MLKDFAIAAAPMATLQVVLEREIEMRKSTDHKMEYWLGIAWRSGTVLTNAHHLLTDHESLTITISELQTKTKMEWTEPMQINFPTVEIDNFTHE